MLYCSIPKVASTTFNTLLVSSVTNISVDTIMKMKNWTHFVHWEQANNGIRRLNTYKPAEVKYRLENYFKFMVVRHPLDRLVSAWRDKFDRHITGGSFKHPNAEQLKRFRKYITHITTEDRALNAHWRAMYRICGPCKIAYDSILKLESLDSDIQFILSKLPGPDGKPMAVPALNKLSPLLAVEKLRSVSEYYRNIDQSAMKIINTKYALDLATFGYDWDITKRQATCGYPKSVADGAAEKCYC